MRFPLVLLVAAVWAASAPAQPPPPVLEQSVVVTGSWQPLPLEEADRSVSLLVVRPQRLLFGSFDELLRLEPSLDLRRRAPGGLQGRPVDPRRQLRPDPSFW